MYSFEKRNARKAVLRGPQEKVSSDYFCMSVTNEFHSFLCKTAALEDHFLIFSILLNSNERFKLISLTSSSTCQALTGA